MTLITDHYFEEAYNHALTMATSGAAKIDVLHYLAGAAEKIAGEGSVSSILVLDENGLLRNGASPQLPTDYLQAIDGIAPDPKVGTCAAAAATGTVVVTPDFCADGKWNELRHLPIALGFTGAWSMPIKTPEGKVVGTFGTYFRERREPSTQEIKGVEQLARAACFVISAS